MMQGNTKLTAVRVLLALVVLGLVVGGASGNAAACNHWFEQPEDEPDYCNDSLVHEFEHLLLDSPVAAMFAAALVGGLFVLSRR